MIFNQRFIAHLLGCLKNTEYLLFEHFAVHKSVPEIPLNILLRKKEQQQILIAIKAFSEIGVTNISNKGAYIELSIVFKDGGKARLNFWHRLSQKNIDYMNIEEVFSQKQRSESEFFMPNIEHLFEFSILHHFLNNEGLAPQYLAYFEDFHFFVKDGLLDFFNKKYNTSFSTLDELSLFELKTKENMMEELKKLPVNHFFKKINLYWWNFGGILRQ